MTTDLFSPAVYSLPKALFATDDAPHRVPLPLPKGFTVKPTPPHGRAHVANLHILVLGTGYPSIVGRLLLWEGGVVLHGAEDMKAPDLEWALEIISASYCIKFQGDVLHQPGVRLCPLGDPPTPPPGAVFNFFQRKRHSAAAAAAAAADACAPVPASRPKTKQAKAAGFVPSGRPRVPDAARADGCIGLLAVRPPSDGLSSGSVLFFCRVAYRASALTDVPCKVAKRVTAAAEAAVLASPFPVSVLSDVYVHVVKGGAALDNCPAVFWDQAPVPDSVHVTVICLTAMMHSRYPLTGDPAHRQLVGDCMTRFMMDMMLADPGLAVTPDAAHVAVALFTNKTPGLMNVKSAVQGVPIVNKPEKKTRPIRNLHPTCAIKSVDIFDGVPVPPPVEPVRDIPLEELERVPLFQRLLTPTTSPLTLRGCEVSVYSTVDGSTLMAGTGHSWVCLGALTYDRIMRPYHPTDHPLGLFGPEVEEDARRACFEILHPALHNVTALETFWAHGRWACPGATRREFVRPYALDNGLLTAAVFWVFGYPGFTQDWTRAHRHVPPTYAGLDVWHLKTYAKAYLEDAARAGRIVRKLLNNRARNIRRDYSMFVLGTYFCATCDDSRPMQLVRTFPAHCFLLGSSRPNADVGAEGDEAIDDVSAFPIKEEVMYTY